MAKGREYAENLVGPLDRSFYDTQRNVAKQINQTNWENLQNQYKNLTDQLKRKQEQANIDFANGLVGVAEGSLSRMANANQDMANRGLSASGLNNLVEQSDTAVKGEQILNLLGSAGDIATATAEQLAGGNSTYANKAAQLNNDLAGTLGSINAGDIAAQMSYNQGLAGIGEDMEAREADNELQAAQRAFNASQANRGSTEEEDKMNEIYKRRAIAETLSDDTLTNQQKANILRVIYDIENANEAVGSYNQTATAIEDYNKELKKLQDAAKKANNKQVTSKYSGKTKKQETVKLDPVDYKDTGNLRGDKTTPRGGTRTVTRKAGNIMTTNEQHALDEYIKKGLTYSDLSRILYPY